MTKLNCLLRKRSRQLLNALLKFLVRHVYRNLHRRRVRVIRTLGKIHVVVRMAILVLSSLMTHNLQRTIRNHLIGIHIG